MKIYKWGVNSITLVGQTYDADSDDIITIPDHLQRSAFTKGFVSAKGRQAQLDAEKAAALARAAQTRVVKLTAVPVVTSTSNA
ncbi:hypothetical protein [Crenothrix polyspora]|uniref:Uncharacterized protein n=1 Tax=Crenothrix polyspora TaxID=360316 RepID=A0A1R4HJ25_9GAMM|nr:hypothetical protein [Crenothrix polyspora]SJM96021.1 hypothetical protein CRENPOLYSF1_830016 [Crenothrix polyspora]